jgi:hypothetical protein
MHVLHHWFDFARCRGFSPPKNGSAFLSSPPLPGWRFAPSLIQPSPVGRFHLAQRPLHLFVLDPPALNFSPTLFGHERVADCVMHRPVVAHHDFSRTSIAAIKSSAAPNGDDGSPRALRRTARRSTSSGQPNCRARLAATAESLAFVSDCEDGFVFCRKISATSPEANFEKVQ